jgi:hypothetical protein
MPRRRILGTTNLKDVAVPCPPKVCVGSIGLRLQPGEDPLTHIKLDDLAVLRSTAWSGPSDFGSAIHRMYDQQPSPIDELVGARRTCCITRSCVYMRRMTMAGIR